MTRYPISGVLIADQRPFEYGLPPVQPRAGLRDQAWMASAAVMAELFEELILVSADPVAYLGWDGLIVRDHFSPPDLLSGIHAGLFTARHTQIFVAAAAAGPLSPAGVDLFLQFQEPRWDAVLPAVEEGVAPLPGFYDKRVLKPLAQCLAGGERRFDRFVSRIRIRRPAAPPMAPGKAPGG